METWLKSARLGLGIAAILGISLMAGACVAAGTEESTAEQDADYVAAKKAIDAKDWNGAIKLLSLAAERDPKNADIQNLLGYSNRKAGNLDLAFKYYGRALELNPNHRGAHEYVGETYLLANNLPKAEEHLAALNKLCFIPCAEYSDLKKAIAAYKQRGASNSSPAGDDSKAY